MPTWWGFVDQDKFKEEPKEKPEYYVNKKGEWSFAQHYEWDDDKYMFYCLMCKTFVNDASHLSSKSHVAKLGHSAFQEYDETARRCIPNVRFNYSDPHGLEEEALKEMEKHGVEPEKQHKAKAKAKSKATGKGQGKGNRKEDSMEDDPFWKEGSKHDPWKESSSGWDRPWQGG